MKHEPVHAPFPGLGLRSLKTAFATTLIALLYYLCNRNPTFACIGVLFGLGSNMRASRLTGVNRLVS